MLELEPQHAQDQIGGVHEAAADSDALRIEQDRPVREVQRQLAERLVDQ